MVLGAASGIIGGLLLEYCGVRKSGYVALSTALSQIAILITLFHPQNFNRTLLFLVLVTIFALAGKISAVIGHNTLVIKLPTANHKTVF